MACTMTFGYVELAEILRQLKLSQNSLFVSGSLKICFGWEASLSSGFIWLGNLGQSDFRAVAESPTRPPNNTDWHVCGHFLAC